MCIRDRSFPVLRDGLNGLRGRPSAETMPALAAVAALLQAVTALLTANSYRTTEGLSILTGVAALGLFLALLGSRVMLSAVRGGYELLGEATDLQGAYRTRDKDLIRALARDVYKRQAAWSRMQNPLERMPLWACAMPLPASCRARQRSLLMERR